MLFTVAVIIIASCSSDSTKEYSKENAQEVFNDLKGTYQGSVLVNNLPQNVTITIGNDFVVRRLPLKPILEKIFIDESQITEALSSAHDVVFTAKVQNIQITTYNVLLTMEPTDFIFRVSVNGKDYQIDAFIKSEAYKINNNTINANLEITELTCDGTAYDITKSPIIYYIDLATRLDNNS